VSLVPRNDSTPGFTALATTAAGLLPFACYLATASAHDHWLDAAEMVAAAVELGVSHPPGHPLAGLLGRVATLLPVGPIPWRMAVLSAVCAALGAAALYRAIETTVRATGVEHRAVATPLALGATWLAAFSPAFWLQAVRPEVYALQFALTALVLERAVHLEARWPTSDLRPLHTGAVALGLSLANHHFLGLLVAPALAPTLARVQRAHGWRPVAAACGLVALGLGVYLYLPLRAAHDPVPNLGSPDDLSRLWWVVSARAYQGSHALATESGSSRLADAVLSVVGSLHVLPALLALAGAYALLRMPGARRIGVMWTLVVVAFTLARAWLGFNRDNPDALGYLMPAVAAGAALAAALVSSAIALVGAGRPDSGGRGGRRPKTVPSRVAVLVAVALAAVGLAQAREGFAAASLSGFTATDEVDDAGRRALPPRAVLVAHQPQTVFRFWGGEASERLRPDVSLVPMPFLGYPGTVESLVRRDPSLTPLLRAVMLHGTLRESELQSLAAERPVLVELDVRVPQALYGTLVPRGLYYEVLADGATAMDRRAGRAQRNEVRARLLERLGSALHGWGTREALLWSLYCDALYDAGTGDRVAARESVALARSLAPEASELRALDEALARPEEEGPLDITPFLPVLGVDTAPPSR
jgi:hypothetical protein